MTIFRFGFVGLLFLAGGASAGVAFESPARAQGFGVNSAPQAATGGTAAPSQFGVAPSTQFGPAPDGKGPQLAKELTQRYQIGMTVTAQGGACQGIYATAPVPINWPEQSVQIVSEEMSPAVQKTEYRTLGGTVKQMLVSMPYIAPGDEAKALVTLEIRRFSLTPPTDTSIYVLPNDKKMPKELRLFLTPSPSIESNHSKIRAIAKELTATHKSDNAWKHVEGIYDWVREKVEYKKGPLKGALRSLQDGNGDCEELSSLFIAVCRSSGIPARIVWVPDHCYPEFYLEDESGKGYWFPCQAAGTREFGGITEHRPILQKGDNFQIPEKPRDRQRYVAEYLTGKGGNPKVKFVREQLGAVP
ncbi:MAG: transglutaminase-like domain-containing protein [Planctomycetia bacterium]|nr:transglutaminase-like domain-containing protein [Planctomycetia bacterium]